MRVDAAVVIVSWNSSGTLERCLDSVQLAASGLRVETVLVDAASCDASMEIAERYPEVRLVRLARNIGFAAAANIGLAMTSAPRVVLLNPDAYPDQGSINALLERLDACEGAAIIGAKLRYPDGRLQPSIGCFPTLAGNLWTAIGAHRMPIVSRIRTGVLANSWHYRAAHKVDWVTAAFCAASRDVGPLPEYGFMYGEDVEWCLEARRRSVEVWLEPRATAVHEVGGSSQSAQGTAKRQELRVMFDDRWFARRGRLAVGGARAIAAVHAALRLLMAEVMRGLGRVDSQSAAQWLALLRAATRRPSWRDPAGREGNGG